LVLSNQRLLGYRREGWLSTYLWGTGNT